MMSEEYACLPKSILNNPTVGMLANWVWRRYIECCIVAGSLDQGGELPPLSELAFQIRTPEKQLEEALEILRSVGLVSENAETKTWSLIKFQDGKLER